jgi:hypothetical protein
MKHEIKKDGELIATIETHGDAVVVVHEPQIKPVQFSTDRDTYVECTPEQRSEIIRIAREYGRGVYGPTEKGFDSDVYINLFWDYNNNHVCGTRATPEDYQSFNWIPFNEFIARLKGEWVEPNPYYSHLIGKWVRYVKDRNMKDYNVGSWYPVKGVDSDGDLIISSLPNDSDNTGWSSPEINFDLTNPRDTNPDEEELVNKPVQFADDRDTCVECTPEQRTEITRIANKKRRRIFGENLIERPNLLWDGADGYLCCTGFTIKKQPDWHWIPFDEFVARLKGEWVEPTERVIPFDIERWRKGDFVRVQTRDEREVMQLTEFNCTDSYPLRGVYNGVLGSWRTGGAYGFTERHKSRHDLMLVVKGGEK